MTTTGTLSNRELNDAIDYRTPLRVKEDAPRFAGQVIIPLGIKIYGISMNVKAGFTEADDVTYSGEFSPVPCEWLRSVE